VHFGRSPLSLAAARAALLTLFTAALIGASSAAVQAQPPGPVRKILVVHYYGSYLPSIELFDRGLLAAIRASSSDAVDFYVEHLDLPRFSGENDALVLASQLHEKYRGAGVRAVIAVSDGALAFLRRYELFQDVPTVAYTEGRPPQDALDVEPNVVRVWSGPTAADTIELAVRLRPSTRRVVVLSGRPNNDGEFEKEARAQLMAFRDRVDVTYLTDLTLEQTLAALRRLPPDAVVLLLRLVTNTQANRAPRDSVPALSGASTVPIYAVRDTAVGYGAVGGYVSDTMAAGFQVAALAIRVAMGARPADLPAERARVVPMFDWRELRRWGIRERDLPAGSQILFKELSTWDRYRWYILGAISLVSIQAVMMAALIIQRTRRRQTEARNSAILRAVPDLMFLQTIDGVYLDHHAPDPNRLLLPPEQFLGKNMRDVLPPVLLGRIGPAFAQATAGSEPVLVEYDLDLADGNRWFEARLVRNNKDQILTLVRDITAHKRAEAALRESAQRYALATTAGGVGVWDRNLDTNELYVDATIKAILGFEDTDIPNRLEDWRARSHPDDAKAVMTKAPACIPPATDMLEAEHRMLHKDGTLRWFLSHGSVMRRADGKPYRIVGTSVDITERKRSADQFRLALEAATTGMLMINRQGRIVLVNAHIERLFGYRREELINEPTEMLVPERFRDEHPGDQSGFHWDGRAFSIPGSRELYGLRKDGTEIPIEIRLSPFQTSEGEFVLSSIADITERRKAEREREYLTGHLQELAGRLIAAQEVERSRIARDLHDDVSQQLAALSIALSGVKRRVAAVAGDTELPDDISSLQERTSLLADSVRHLSHDLHPDVLRHAGLTAALTAYCNGLSQSQGLVVTCSALGDFESIDQDIALCLYRIAQEALHNVVKHSGARQAEVRLLRTGDGAEITIIDNGKGFDIQRRKSGTGLGLISITERARLAGGTVTIVTAVNEGTQVRVQVPIHAATDTGDASGGFVSV
jgi:PAS domain S-box-containing protein